MFKSKDKLFSDDEIFKIKSDLKADMVKAASVHIKPKKLLDTEQKTLIIKDLISQLPSLLAESIKESKDTVYLFPISISRDIRRRLSEDFNERQLFEQVVEDVASILHSMDIKIRSASNAISIRTKDLLEFCKFEKLIALK